MSSSFDPIAEAFAAVASQPAVAGEAAAAAAAAGAGGSEGSSSSGWVWALAVGGGLLAYYLMTQKAKSPAKPLPRRDEPPIPSEQEGYPGAYGY